MKASCLFSLDSILSLSLLLSLPTIPAFALGPTEIRSRAQQIDAALRGVTSSAAENDRVAQLGDLVLAFIELSEKTSRAGTSQSELKPAFEALHAPLDRVYRQRNEYMEREARAVMDADGDLEALYESAPYREAQSVAAHALYFLNWLNFYGAQLYDGTRRKELLEAAERGFSEFTDSARKDLASESLLGRGLCWLELGHGQWAVEDFKAVIEEATVSAERKAKARLALLDGLVRSGDHTQALQYSQQLLSGGADGNVNVVRYYRLQALFALAKKGGTDAERHRREAASLMDQLRAAGKSWADKVDALMVASIDDPSQWVEKANSPAAKFELARLLLQKGDEARAVTELQSLLDSKDPAAAEFHGEASYWIGATKLKAGDYAGAEPLLQKAVSDSKPSFAADASYLRFKALEAQMAQSSTPEIGKRYFTAMREFLCDHPTHPAAHEAHYRLGEYLQSEGRFEEALSTYAQVKGDANFELRARFNSLQCEYELLKSSPPPTARKEILARIRSGLDDFWQRARALAATKDHGGVPLAEFQAKTTLLQAVYLSLADEGTPEQILDTLQRYEEYYANEPALVAQAVRLRLAALQRLERYAEAEQQVRQHASVLQAEAKTEAIERLASGFVRAAARKKSKGDAESARAAEQVALRLYELLFDTGGAGAQQKLTLARLYISHGELPRAEALYNEILKESPQSLAALRGLAQVEEGRRNHEAALRYWTRYTEAARPGDPPWYEGRYQQARITLARGDARGSCAQLKDLRPAMAGLGDAELRQELNRLYQQACQ